MSEAVEVGTRAPVGGQEQASLRDSLALDLSNPGSDFRRLMDEVAPSVVAELEPVYERLARSDVDHIPWLLSSLCSRNAMMSPLIERVCAIRAIERFVEEAPLAAGGVLTLDCEDTALGNALERRFAELPYRVSVRYRRLIAGRVQWLKVRFGAILMLARRLLSWLGQRVQLSDRAHELPDGVTILEAFHTRGGEGVTSSERPYGNRYYGALETLVEAPQRKGLRYWLTPAGFPDNGRAYADLRRNSSSRLIYPDGFLKLSDWLRLCWAPIAVAFKSLPESSVGNLRLDGLLRREKWSRALSADWLIGYLYYLAIGRMKELDYRVELWIDWFENQPVDKGVLLSLRKHYPAVFVRGHRGFIPCPVTQAYANPLAWEVELGWVPDALSLPSRVLSDELRESHGHLAIETCPGFRFSGLAADLEASSPKAGSDVRGEILLALPIAEAQARTILGLAGQLVRDRPEHGERLVVRPHPSQSGSKVRSWLEASGIGEEAFVPSDTLAVDLARCRVMISAASTTCVEALLKGKRVLIAAPSAGITPLPIPDCFPRASWSVVYDAASALTRIDPWLAEDRVTERERSWTGESFFEPVTAESVGRFLERAANP